MVSPRSRFGLFHSAIPAPRLAGILAVAVAACLTSAAQETATTATLGNPVLQLKTESDGTRSVSCRESSKLTPADYEAIGKLPRLKSLTLYGKCSLTDETLVALAGLDELEKVGIDGAKLSDDGLKAMANWKSLRQLTFFHIINPGKFSGAGVAHLAALPKLESFGCGGSSFTDEGMAACAQLPHLTDLRIWHTGATNTGVAELTKLKRLRSLRLAPQFRPRITGAAVESLAAIPSLETLSLGEMRLTWEGGLKHLKALPNLKKLELDLVDISDADLARLKTELPGVAITRKPPDDKQLEQLRRNWANQAS